MNLPVSLCQVLRNASGLCSARQGRASHYIARRQLAHIKSQLYDMVEMEPTTTGYLESFHYSTASTNSIRLYSCRARSTKGVEMSGVQCVNGTKDVNAVVICHGS